ncbi:CidA/LrgA family protein [Camelimonas abortus]|uniref:CidA/LrgA family protein n=1 Tax=Camelimonas abortus TaxID=1017184 RepID=A0ABV7LEI0_9HYPH
MSNVLMGLAGLLLCQLAGEAVSRLLALPVPGPVTGMALMAAILLLRGGRPPEPVVQASRGLIGVLSLLFVPAGVGVISLGPVVADRSAAILAALAVSLVITLAVTAWTYALAARWQARRRAGGGGEGAQ